MDKEPAFNRNTHINKYLKHKWVKCSNQDIDWLNRYKNKKYIYMPSTRNQFQIEDTDDK